MYPLAPLCILDVRAVTSSALECATPPIANLGSWKHHAGPESFVYDLRRRAEKDLQVGISSLSCRNEASHPREVRVW